MTTRVIIVTGEHPAAVMSYPREGGEPVEGASYTEIAQVPPGTQFETVVHAGQDVLVIEMPPVTPVTQDSAMPVTLPGEAESEAA